MLLRAYSVFDQAVGAFLPPFFCRARGEALRSFMEACSDPKHMFGRYNADYVLYDCGEFDDGSGIFTSGLPERILSARECVHSQDARVSASEVSPSSPE